MLRLALQTRLERGAPPNFVTAFLAREWSDRARVTTALVSAAPTLCIGGATLGGSGRTPLAIACARFLAGRGLDVALVAHGYRGKLPPYACIVQPDDDARVRSDEAIECARALRDVAKVLVARDRQVAVDAAQRCDVVILDGPLQLAPKRATLSLLALDAENPWGSRACPPLGNLKASKRALLAAVDDVVTAGLRGECTPRSRGVWVAGCLVPYAEIAKLRIGLITAVARPERVVAWLHASGVTVQTTRFAADHSRLPRLKQASACDLWLTTAKDAARQPTSTYGVIDYHLDLPPRVTKLLKSRF